MFVELWSSQAECWQGAGVNLPHQSASNSEGQTTSMNEGLFGKE